MTRPDQTRPDQTRPDQNCALVSVIIPVYNVEEYVARCLESVLAQTYRNLEIVIIDDGSTDSSGKICDEYAKRDSRIRVIHQENVGLAEVRNIGIRESRGEWIQFVDSDDWIDPETIETCCNYARQYNADIVSFCFIAEQADGTQSHQYGRPETPVMLDSAQAVSMFFFHSYIGTSSCDKLIKAKLFEGITFPKEKVFEDTYAVYKLLSKTDRILCTGKEHYHYFMREDSITHEAFSDKSYLVAEAAQGCFDFATSNYQLSVVELRNLSVGVALWKIGVVDKMFLSNYIDRDYISEVRSAIKLSDVFLCRHIKFKTKLKLLLFWLNPSGLYRIYRKLRG